MRLRLLLLSAAAGALLLISTGSAAPPPIRVDVPPTTEATSLSATSVTYGVKAWDTTVDPNVPITATCTGGSGSGNFSVTADFPLGNNSANCSATLGDGTPVSQGFTVAVVDTTAPSFGPAPPVTESTTDPAGKTVGYSTPTATDLGQSVTVNCTPASGSQFVVGTTQVNCSADDGRGNTGHVSFNVTVTLNDNQPPTFTPNPPPPISATTSGTGAVVNFTVAATDDSGTPTVNCTPASGSTFPVGQTTVNCTASDGTNTANASFTVTVTFVDTAAPTFSNVPSSVVVEANGPSGSVATYTPPTGVAFVFGSDSTTLPTSGSFTYTLAGGPKAVNTAGVVGGTLATGAFQVNFGAVQSLSVATPLTLSVGGVNYALTTACGGSCSFAAPSLNMAISLGGTCSGGACLTSSAATSTATGVLVGAHADGLTVTGNIFSAAPTVNFAGAFKR